MLAKQDGLEKADCKSYGKGKEILEEEWRRIWLWERVGWNSFKMGNKGWILTKISLEKNKWGEGYV